MLGKESPNLLPNKYLRTKYDDDLERARKAHPQASKKFDIYTKNKSGLMSNFIEKDTRDKALAERLK
jgi:hypothetical protein